MLKRVELDGAQVTLALEDETTGAVNTLYEGHIRKLPAAYLDEVVRRMKAEKDLADVQVKQAAINAAAKAASAPAPLTKPAANPTEGK